MSSIRSIHTRILCAINGRAFVVVYYKTIYIYIQTLTQYRI